jgi:superfamily II DNA/RNA helicase
MRVVNPTSEELELINAISEPIKELGFFAQIGILQALISSPQALAALLKGMAQRGTAPASLYNDVKAITGRISTTAKLHGLGILVNNLKEKQPDLWRVVIFTTRRETQTTIQEFLEKQGISCGLINGDSGERNQATITRFKQNPPAIHAIISTEAGSEGVNLQAANVLVNYDLPWNPMIVEQRIGRIQRLASEHANVCIFNMVLKGTFEEYIVGRLMEKLQMASHAIGDIEALLEASGMNGEDDSSSFEEKIRQLVMDSLAGKNVEEAVKKAKDSIENAKKQLASEEKNINTLLGQTNSTNNNGPRCPQLPKPIKSMTDREFVLSALSSLGARLIPQDSGLYISNLNGDAELISFDSNESSLEISSTLYRAGTSS